MKKINKGIIISSATAAVLVIAFIIFKLTNSHHDNFKLTNTKWAPIDSIMKQAGLHLSHQIESSKLLYELSLNESRNIGYNYGIAHSLIGLSIFDIENGAHQNANEKLNEAYPYCLKAEHKKDYIIGVWYDNKGSNSKHLSQNDSAVYFYENALVYAKKADNIPVMTTIHTNLGALFIEGYHSSHEYSIQHLHIALSLAQDNLPTKLPIIHSNLATVYEKTKNDSLFLYHAQKALDACKAVNDVRVRRYILSIMADYYLNKKIYATAIHINNLGLEIHDPHVPFTKFSFLYGLAANNYELGNYHLALQQALETVALLNHTERNSKNPNEVYQLIANIYEHIGDYKKAYEYEKIFIEKNISYANVATQKALEQFKVQYETSLKDAALEQQKRALQQKNNWMLTIIVISTLTITVLLLLFRAAKNKQKLKNIALKELEQKHQIAYLSAQMQGEAIERQRISKDLHDGVASTLAAAKMKLTNINNLPLEDFSQTAMFRSGIELVNEAYNDIRYTAHNLSAQRIVENGIVLSMQTFCEKINNPPQFTVHFSSFGEFSSLNGSFVYDLYRILQELLHNIIKYAQATEVAIQIMETENEIQMSIEDNGLGADINTEKSNGLGWNHIQTSINTWGGEIEFDHRASIGTTIYVSFPLPLPPITSLSPIVPSK